MNTKHTPEPWHIGMKPGPIIYGPKGEQIADLRLTLLDKDEHIANVFLMVRAPALLAENARLREALWNAVELVAMAERHICSGSRGCLGEQAKYHRVMRQARAALAESEAKP